MPYVIRGPHTRLFAAAAACFVLLGCAQTAAAAPVPPPPPTPPSVCPMPATSAVFSSLGDNASYFLVPGADFEGRLGGWSLTPGTSVVQGNESSFVAGSSDSRSLNINAGAQAVSPVVCVSTLFPAWRFFANAANTSPGTTLHVSAQFTTNAGQSGVVPVTDLSGGAFNSWAATSSLPLGSVLAPGTTENVRFVFSADPAGAGWKIDDAFVDPYAR